METDLIFFTKILNDFLNRWPQEKIDHLTLDQYVSVGDPDTFCHWVEIKTQELGSARGLNSLKFGIYKRWDKKKKLRRYKNDEGYTWLSRYGDNRIEAFNKIKRDLVSTIEYAMFGKFSAIDEIGIPDFFKWKVAYLYSNERLIPIFKRKVLVKIAKHYGLNIGNHIVYSKIHEVIIKNKPIDKSIYEYASELYKRFKVTEIGDNQLSHFSKKKRQRNQSNSKSTDDQKRKGSGTYVANQLHNKLQMALKSKLVAEFGPQAVKLEENFVDVMLELPSETIFYEVKSASYASDCIKEALGQILLYVSRSKSMKRKSIVIVGQYTPNEDELEYLNFIKSQIKMPLRYETIEINDI
ncbi:MAG: hypothetical protein ACYC49_00210 [Ignavibacteriaceae bacterium]